jgi:hypothetical protein
MAIFEIEGPDGKTYEVEAPDMNAAVAAISSMSAGPQRNPDGTYGQPPEGFVQNTMTGQMEDIRSPNNPNIPTGRGTALAAGLAQGVTFGASDEGTAAIGTMMNPGSNYDYELARAREINRRGAEDQPLAYYGGLIPGAAASSYMGARGLGVNLTGPTLLNTVGRSAGAGAVEGALYGFNTGEGGAGNRAGSAVNEAVLGAGIGAAAPYVVAGGRAAFNTARDVVEGGVDAAIGRANQGRANRAIIDTLNKSGRSLDDVADDVARAAREGQPEFRTMDALGLAGQRRTSGVVRAGGDGAEEIAQFLNQRQLDQVDRVGSFVDDAFGSTGTTAAQTRESLTAARGAQADAAYAAARGNAAPVDVRGALSVIDDRIGGMQGMNVAGDGIDGRLASFRSRLAASTPPDGATGVELSDFDRVLGVKQDVQDAIGAAVRAGRNNEARELGKLSAALDQALEASSDGYRAANDGFREASRTIEAVDTGAQMATRGRAADTVPAFQAMTPDQQNAARVGYANSIIDDLERNRATTANAARQFNSTKRATEAQAMATDPRLFGDRIARENTMWETQNRALGGSRTADNLQDIGELGPRAEIARALLDIGNLQFGQAAGRVGNAIAPAVTGMNESTRKLIADALMSSDPRAALASAMRQESLSQGQRRVFEALTRAIGREVTP